MELHEYAVIPHLTVKNAAAAIEFYKSVLGFNEVTRSLMPDGKVMHCQLELRGFPILLNEYMPGMSAPQSDSQAGAGPSITLTINVPDVDATFAKAVAAGAKPAMPVADMFWGDRYGKIIDPFGQHWAISTHKENVSHEEANRRAAEFFKKWKK
ncbi:MAG: VOC family protein [Tepidisphaeraceae bacterium]|jgi:PhnB protein